MQDQLKQILGFVSHFKQEDWEVILPCFETRLVTKGELLLREGEFCNAFYVVIKGCIRVYFLDSKGNEMTRYVMPDFHIGTALSSFISQKPSLETVEALEDSMLHTISHGAFYKLVDVNPAFAAFYRKILEMAYQFQTNKIESLVNLSAAERYQQVLKTSPDLVQRLSNRILASYLDIREETLSRLKSERF